MKEKVYSDLTEKEKEEIISKYHVIGFKSAQDNMRCVMCGGNIEKGNVIYVSDFSGVDCCSTDCSHDVFRSSMD